MIDLDPAAIENILTFLGYGNPGGIWFVGKEEGLSQMNREDRDSRTGAERPSHPCRCAAHRVV